MNPVLIFTDTARISAEKATLNKIVPIYQAVYTALKNIGIAATIADIAAFDQLERRGNSGDFINNYVKGKLLDKLAPYEINGVAMTRDFFINNIDMPDTSAVKTALQPVHRLYENTVNGPRVNLLALAADTISKVNDSDAQITTLFTYYTTSDRSAQLATDLQAVCDALNTFDGSNDDMIKYAVVGRGYTGAALSSGETNLPGIKLASSEFVIDLDFIRTKEKTWSH